jgi:hypothetical protein
MKYITHINGVDLSKANAVQCAELIDINHLELYHPSIVIKVEKLWEQQHKLNSECRCMQEE